jgi:hypothetical protein
MSAALEEAIRSLGERLPARLAHMGEPAVSQRPGPGKWCPKEILGHLVDSALNNLQRFVRAQQADSLEFPGYEQEQWVRLQGWAGADWAEVLSLWRALNAQAARVVAAIPREKLSIPCRIGSGEPASLEAVIRGYVTHAEHHLAQIV